MSPEGAGEDSLAGRALPWIQGGWPWPSSCWGVRTLAVAAQGLSFELQAWLPRLMRGPLSALGLAWATTYALLNGSVVAALGLVLLQAGLLSLDQTFLVVAGSRLGAAGFVVLVGGIDYVRRRRATTVREALRMGVLAFLVTASVYLPATVVGTLDPGRLASRLGRTLPSALPSFPGARTSRALVKGLTETVGPWPTVAGSVVLLVLAL